MTDFPYLCGKSNHDPPVAGTIGELTVQWLG